MGLLEGNINCFNNAGFDVLDLSRFGQIFFRNMRAEEEISQFHRNKMDGKEMGGRERGDKKREMKDITARRDSNEVTWGRNGRS